MTLNKFHKCQNCSQGTVNICKMCKSKGLKIPKDYVKPEFNRKWSNNDKMDFRLNGVSKEDFRVMYEFLRGSGYNVDGDVHQQFLDKWNPVSKRPMKYKERNYKSLNQFSSDGKKNPMYQPTAFIKKPPTN